MLTLLPLSLVACGLLPASRPDCDPEPELENVFGREVLFVDDLNDLSCVRQVKGGLHLNVEGPVVLPGLEVVSGAIRSSQRVTSLDVPKLRYAGTVSAGPATETVHLPALKAVENVHFDQSFALREVDLSGLERVDDLLVVTRNPELETIEFTRLEHVDHTAMLKDNPKLVVDSKMFPALRRVDNFEVVDNASTVACDSPLGEWSRTLEPTTRSRGRVLVTLDGAVCQKTEPPASSTH